MSTDAYRRVKIARNIKRPTGIDYIQGLCCDFLELHGDRLSGDDPAVVGGVALLNDMPVTIIAVEKGHTTRERVYRSFGAPNPEGYRKAQRLMKQAEKFHRPVICLVDTSGAFCGISAEERGQGHAIAASIIEMISLQTPIISILTGEGGSGGALALSVSDRVWMLENAIYSVISPEGCASILYGDSKKAEDAAEKLKLTAEDAYENRMIERIIEEKGLGTLEFYEQLRYELYEELTVLSSMDTEELLQERYMRFRRIGDYDE